MIIKLYNTLTRKVEEFKPINPPTVGMYSCGPTVYNYAHLGHARTYVFADILKRVLTYFGFEVKHVMNITDVGHLTEADISDEGQDKIEMAAKKEKKTVWDIAKFYTDDFFKMIDDLNIIRPLVVCKATEHIGEMIELIKKIEKNGFTYIIDRGVCFDTSKFPAYPDFARLNLEKMKKGARVEFDPQKKNPTDFWLWRFSNPEEKRQMEWDSPWAPRQARGKVKGFPGWHIECSAMSMKYLGERFDIHTGGIDHIPVHHTNEIAQNWAATGHQVVNYWIHGEFLEVEGQKMSKSLGNFYRVEDLKNKGYNPVALRYLFLNTHYRTKLNFTWNSLKAAQKTLDKLYEIFEGLKQSPEREVLSGQKLEKIDKFQEDFREALANDLNLPQAVAIVWKMLKSNIPSYDKKELLLDWDQVLGLGFTEARSKKQEVRISEEVKKLVSEREKLRKQGNWQEADEIRKKINKLGYIIEDTDKGPRLKPVLK